jgi:hypothetical protein
VAATRYEEQSGAEFEVLVFATAPDARGAAAQLGPDTDRERPGGPDGPAAYIRSAIRRVAVACRRGVYADRQVREACTDRPSGLEPRPREPV